LLGSAFRKKSAGITDNICSRDVICKDLNLLSRLMTASPSKDWQSFLIAKILIHCKETKNE
jgi:hypothetical protein